MERSDSGMAPAGTLADLREAFQLMHSGQLEQALARLDALQADLPVALLSEWWRMRGLAQVHQGKYAQAEAAYLEAYRHCGKGSLEAGRIAYSYGALLGQQNRRQEALAAYFDARNAFSDARDDAALVAVSYNLGWSLLQLLRVNEAAQVFEEALLASERAAGRPFRALLHLGRSYVTLLRGDPLLALAQAEWASTVAQTGELEVRALHQRATLHHLLGHTSLAQKLCEEALANVACQGNQPLYSGVALTQALLHEHAAQVEDLLPTLLPLQQTRAWLHLAQRAWRQGDLPNTRWHLQQALTLSAYARAAEAMFLPALYRWAQAEGFALPDPPTRPSRTVTIYLRGELHLEVNGHPIKLPLSPEAAALAAHLHLYGATRAGRLASYVLGASRLDTVRRTAERIRLLIGDQSAVQVTGEGAEAQYHLSAAWTWQVSTDGAGRLLHGLDSPFKDECFAD